MTGFSRASVKLFADMEFLFPFFFSALQLSWRRRSRLSVISPCSGLAATLTTAFVSRLSRRGMGLGASLTGSVLYLLEDATGSAVLVTCGLVSSDGSGMRMFRLFLTSAASLRINDAAAGPSSALKQTANAALSTIARPRRRRSRSDDRIRPALKLMDRFTHAEWN